MTNSIPPGAGQLRLVQPQWNTSMVAASIAISFLGAFTSAQLMCQARSALHFSSVFVWALLGSLIFGFCSIWSLHFTAMLAYEFDVSIGVHAPLTILSAILAVSFTFLAVAGDLLYARYRSASYSRHRRRMSRSRGQRIATAHLSRADSSSSAPLLEDEDEHDVSGQLEAPTRLRSERPSIDEYMQSNGGMVAFAGSSSNAPSASSTSKPTTSGRFDGTSIASNDEESASALRHSSSQTSSDFSEFRRLSVADSSSGSFGLRSMIGLIHRNDTTSTGNAFLAVAKTLYAGVTTQNVIKGFIWSLAVTSMHYSGLCALRIPQGFFHLNPGLVLLSAFNSWVTCTVGFILMANMETHLSQQLLFSVIATTGVSAMHFTGMAATTFWSEEPASVQRGFPPALGGTVVAVAFVTCMVANVLLSHSATVSRNKLAEIFWTRRELYKNIALKEHAEAAARLRSEFIASASHEIRTPLHHLQGYSDLLAQTELTEEGRRLMSDILRATKTLALLTNNVLDWSKFEGNTHGEYRPSDVDIRVVCESIVTLLPNFDEDAEVEIYVCVAPEVPRTLRLDESWVYRIIMNLLSNALKFTKRGYILLLLDMQGTDLTVVVKDTGCGMDAGFIPDMWAPFRQGEVRGSARGTGLGLSIVRQLLHRMSGSIEVESLHEDAEGVGPLRSGTKFTVTFPLSSDIPQSASLPATEETPKIAIMSNDAVVAEGLEHAWQTFKFTVSLVYNVAELGQTRWTYVWAELDFLKKNEDSLTQLLKRQDLLILIPYETQDNLDSLPALLKARNIVLIHKPLIWHKFLHRVRVAKERRLSSTPQATQALRFAPEVEVIGPSPTIKPLQGLATASKRQKTVLLVEDNPINRKLGAKMLHALSYKTLFANNGEEALSVLFANNEVIDCVLMDQSMPVMDGQTSTRRIRKMEKEGKLKPGRPIIAVTAVVNQAAQEAFTDAGADDFLAKPLSLERLRDILAVYLPVDVVNDTT